VAVLTLQIEPPLDGLNVGERGLRIDRETPRRGADHRVPGAPTAVGGDRDLGLPDEAGVDQGMKPLEEPLLRRVPDRIAGAERPEPDVESHRRSDRSDLLERELGDEATLEPPSVA